MSPDPDLSEVFREEWGRLVATLVGSTGDFDLAEECAQEAFAVAQARWPVEGVPRRPGAWLTTVARNRAIDRLRRQGREAAKLGEVAALDAARVPGSRQDEGLADDRLRLIFTCCHPALPVEGRVSLALRTLAGLSTAEIARAFLVSEPTMAKRLVRAKQKIKHAGIPYRVPSRAEWPGRLSGVLGVLYLLFNEGYAAMGDELIREQLCEEAIRLARLLVELLPEEAEPAGLLALLRLHHARRRGRVDEQGDVVTLEEQDRGRWDRVEIEDACRALAAVPAGAAGPYCLQAQIAACHARAARPEDTDWAAILRCYDRLLRARPTPVVALNRAVAVAMCEGPLAGLRLVDALAGEDHLDGYYLLAATRADLLRRLGRGEEAGAAYRLALEQAPSEPERRFLARRLAELAGPAPPRPEETGGQLL